MRILSHSQANMFSQCPWKWFASYRLKMPRPSSLPFAEGLAVHTALASYWNGNKNWKEVLQSNLDWRIGQLDIDTPTFGKENGVIKANLIEDVFERDTALIKNLLDEMYYYSLKVIQVEKKWRKPAFVGYVDWRGTLNGVEYIFDWKTSDKPYDVSKVNDDEQLTCYAALTGIKHVGFGVMCKSDLSVQILTSARTNDQISEYWKKVARIRKQMKGAIYPPKEGWYCGGRWGQCNHFGICPAKGDF